MNDQNRDIWFPAKKYGVGWGFPVAWQGWVVFLGYIALVMVGITLLVTNDSPGLVFPFIIYLFFLTGLLIFICYKKGEKIDLRRRKKL